jgi:hypothetical protein
LCCASVADAQEKRNNWQRTLELRPGGVDGLISLSRFSFFPLPHMVFKIKERPTPEERRKGAFVFLRATFCLTIIRACRYTSPTN